MSKSWEKYISTQAEMIKFSANCAKNIEPFIPGGFTIFLSGELGAGKTFFTQQLLRAWGYTSVVKSPTYGLVEIYELNIGVICHFDLYRLHNSNELEEMGFRDYWGPGHVCIVEWPERGEKVLSTPDIALQLQFNHERFAVNSVSVDPAEQRRCLITAHTVAGEKLLRNMMKL